MPEYNFTTSILAVIEFKKFLGIVQQAFKNFGDSEKNLFWNLNLGPPEALLFKAPEKYHCQSRREEPDKNDLGALMD